MNLIFSYLFEASVCLAVSLLLYRGLCSGLTFFSWNRAVLLAILVFSLTIPLMKFEGFGFGNEVVQELTLPTFQVGDSVQSENSGWNWMQVLFVIYLAGVVWVSTKLILGLILSQRLIGKSRIARYADHWVAIHPQFVPASFFQYILMPDFNPEDSRQLQILAHESVHVRLRHSWDLLLVNFAKVVFWFNPLVYEFEKSLREVHEYQADQGVTAHVPPKEYATLLLQLITSKPGWQFMNNFNQFQTKKRILMLTKTNSKPQQKVRFLALIPAVALLVFVFACEISPEQKVNGPTQVAEAKSLGPSDISARITVGTDEIFDVTEEMPTFPGGMEKWVSFLGSNLKYPEEARKKGLEGTVILMFEIHQDGSVHNPEILRGVSEEIDQEALRVLSNSPDWMPGKQKGEAVKTRMRLPIQFKLGTVSDADFAPRTRQINQKLAQFEWSKGKLNAIPNAGDNC